MSGDLRRIGPNLSRRDYFQLTGLGLVSLLAVGDSKAEAPDPDDLPPEFPAEPHIALAHGAPYFRDGGDLGWDGARPIERMETLRRLHPELLDFRRLLWVVGDDVPVPPGMQNQLTFAEKERLPATAGQTPYIRSESADTIDDRYQSLREERDWRFPDGSPVENRRDLFGEDLSGDWHSLDIQNDLIGLGSVFCPALLDILTAEAAGAFDNGFVGMFFDSTTTPRSQGLDASEWAQAAFREHLHTLSEERRDKLGVNDIESFDIREGLESRDILPESGDHPATDPLYREYTLFHHQGMKALVQGYADWIADTYPDREGTNRAELYGNHWVGTEFDSSVAVSIYTAEPMDVVNVEDDRTKPPEYKRAVAYKLFNAASRDGQPVMFEGEMHQAPGEPDKYRGLETGRIYTRLMRLQLAEAYAEGVTRKLSLTSWGNIESENVITHWIETDGSVPATLQSFADFLFTSRRFLAGTEADSNIAVVYSMPTGIWQQAPQWGRSDQPQSQSFYGACRALTDAGVPYDVRIFGHERLWNDEDELSALADYDAVVVPNHNSIAERHVETLETVLEAGGTVVVSGDPPDRDEYYRRTDFSVFDENSVEIFHDDPAGEYMPEMSGADGIIDELSPLASVTASTTGDLGVSRRRQSDPERIIVHLVNYDWDEDADAMNEKSDVSVTISDLPFGDPVARFISPTETTELSPNEADGGWEVQAPTLKEWGFIVLCETESDLSPEMAQETAADLTQETKDRLEQSREQLDAPEDDRGFRRAELIVEEADLALEAGAYDVAEDRLTAAETAIENLPTRGDDGETTPEETTPGFGILGALAGIGGASYLLNRRRGEESDE